MAKLEEFQQLLVHTIKENLKLEARVIVLEKTLLVLLSKGDLEQLQYLKDLHNQQVLDTIEQVIVDHPMLDQTWRNVIRKNLDDIEGLDL